MLVFLDYEGTFLNHINGFVLATGGFQATDMFAIVYCLSPFRPLSCSLMYYRQNESLVKVRGQYERVNWVCVHMPLQSLK